MLKRLAVALATVPLLLVAPVLPSVPAVAGTVAEHPEFPYPVTAYDEPYRGQFHFSSRGGWMNDINAPLYHDGTYHLFYQHNPHGLGWDTMHWGHATSTDLVRWTQKPIALEPGVHPGDLWSGGGVVDTGNVSGLGAGGKAPILVFSGTNGVIVHYSTDGAQSFQTYDGGRKVITPAGTSRDPKVFWHAASNRWVMVVWSDAGGNGVDLYTSTNLLDWTYRSRYAADWLYECPDMFALAVDGDVAATRWVLTDASGEYVVGDFDGTTFSSAWSSPQRMDYGDTRYGGTFYAGLVFSNMPDGRTVQMAWQPGNRGSVWTGNATFPVELALRTFPEGVRLTRNPVAELASLRSQSSSWSDRTVTADPAGNPLAGVTDDAYELTAEFDVAGASASRFGLLLGVRANGTHQRAVTYERAAQTLHGAPLTPANGRIRVRVLVDRGQVEIFGNDGRLSVTDNVDFDPASSNQGMSVYAEDGSVRLVSLSFHRLASGWGTGESTLDSNLPGQWRAAGGTWTDVAAGKRGQADGDAFYLSDATGGDFTYEGDVRVDSGAAAALTFRANADASEHYTANIDTGGLVRLWRPGRIIADHRTPVTAGRTYHLKVVASGARLRVYLDHGATPVIDATDTAYASGRFGANVFSGVGVVRNLNVDAVGFDTNLTGPWRPVGGRWTTTASGARATTSGDAFYLSERIGTDLTYEADVRVVHGGAAGLTVRANADASEHYTANIDAGGLVRLWRPGRIIADHRTAIVPGRTYHLEVTTNGSTIRVSLDNTDVITTTDTAYASGRLGLNVYQGTGQYQNVRVTG
jgi:fructan beta-fructosidase